MNVLLRSSIRVPAALLLLLLTPLTYLPVYLPACLPACYFQRGNLLTRRLLWGWSAGSAVAPRVAGMLSSHRYPQPEPRVPPERDHHSHPTLHWNLLPPPAVAAMVAVAVAPSRGATRRIQLPNTRRRPVTVEPQVGVWAPL
jgi:hypothetical protein